jgi:polypyrimidine tract-binding protein 2
MCRDYTNPYLPVNPTAIEGIAQVCLQSYYYIRFFVFLACCLHHGNLQPTLGSDGKIKEPESNVLLASIENMQYAVGVDVLHTVRVFFVIIFSRLFLV